MTLEVEEEVAGQLELEVVVLARVLVKADGLAEVLAVLGQPPHVILKQLDAVGERLLLSIHDPQVLDGGLDLALELPDLGSGHLDDLIKLRQVLLLLGERVLHVLGLLRQVLEV
uniref:Uncharacterized protein n=1 Tax=Strombidium rassoulzadegani TaxID=1082188 RepID=A0A7S3CTS6_9SPIT